MIFGCGVDIVQVSRFLCDSWDENKILRFFNKEEILTSENKQLLAEHYAARFGAKEAFGKALGLGIREFSLNEVYVLNDALGKPELKVTGKAALLLKEKAGNCRMHLSLSHEKEYAVAYLIIEQL